jgi:hypothetical protein
MWAIKKFNMISENLKNVRKIVLFKYWFLDNGMDHWTYGRKNALSWMKQGIKIKVIAITEKDL